MACKAPFFSREHVLQLPGRRWLDSIAPATEEFVAKENVNFGKGDKQASEGVVHADDDTVPAANLPPPPELAPHPDLLRHDALTFDPSPVLKDDNEYSIAAPDNQAELMRWHYCLGHASYTKLKQLARNGKIPAKLAYVCPPRCAGCLFGAMIKIPWRTKQWLGEDHAVFCCHQAGGVHLR